MSATSPRPSPRAARAASSRRPVRSPTHTSSRAGRPPTPPAPRPSGCGSSRGAWRDGGMIGLMARRSPARFLAPLALVGFVVALYVVVDGARDDAGSRDGGATPAASASASPTKKQKARKVRKSYRVKPGDTPSSIAEKTNVPLSQIQALNPNLDDQTLSVGQKIKLRR